MYLLFTSLAILSKIPAGIYFALSIPVIFSNLNRKRVIIISALTLIPLTFCYIWYFIWNPYLSITYNSWYNDGKSISEGFSEIINNLYLVFRNFYFHSFVAQHLQCLQHTCNTCNTGYTCNTGCTLVIKVAGLKTSHT